MYITIVSRNTHVPHDDISIPIISIHPLRSSSTNGSQLGTPQKADVFAGLPKDEGWNHVFWVIKKGQQVSTTQNL